MTKKKAPQGRKKEPTTGRASVTMPLDLWADVQSHAEENGRTLRKTVEMLVRAGLKSITLPVRP